MILRHCFQVDRRTAGLMPSWERELLIAAGERLLGTDDADASNGSFTPSEMHVLMNPGVG